MMNTGMMKGLLAAAVVFIATACAEYRPPFTCLLDGGMTFAQVERIAAREGFLKHRVAAGYKGFRLLGFEKEGCDEVFLIVDRQGRPMFQTMGYGVLSRRQLVNFVDDYLKHQSRLSGNKAPGKASYPPGSWVASSL